jgi:hypothetical protein
MKNYGIPIRTAKEIWGGWFFGFIREPWNPGTVVADLQASHQPIGTV